MRFGRTSTGIETSRSTRLDHWRVIFLRWKPGDVGRSSRSLPGKSHSLTLASKRRMHCSIKTRRNGSPLVEEPAGDADRKALQQAQLRGAVPVTEFFDVQEVGGLVLPRDFEVP